MLTENVRFRGGTGFELAGTLVRPSVPLTAWALLAHCFTCNRNYKILYNLAKALATRGIGSLRFDFTGLGESRGRFEDTNLTTNIADLLAAADFLRSQGGVPRILIGHSLGGAASLLAARRIAGVQAVVTIATPFRPAQLERLFTPQREAMHAAPDQVFPVLVSGREVGFKLQFLDDLARHDLPAAIAGLGLPLLVFHSATDTTTEFANAEQIWATASHPKSVIDLVTADHLVPRREDAEFIASIIGAWYAWLSHGVAQA